MENSNGLKSIDEILTRHERPFVCETHSEQTERGYQFSKKVIWTGCPECNAIESERKKKEAEEREAIKDQERIEARLNRAGIPERFKGRKFDCYVADTDKQKSALEISQDFADNFDRYFVDGHCLIFSGKAGTGKSHLAIAIAQTIMPRYTALYMNAMDIIRMVRDTWRKDSEKSEEDVLKYLTQVSLLVIDEVGVQVGTENEQMLMFEVINRRYRDMRPMILLTNLNKQGFSDYMTERSFDRLRENGRWITFDWESHRGSK